MKNQIVLNDCLLELRKMEDDSIDLIYLDPPFFTQKIHKLKNRLNTQEYTFEDKWDGLNEYCEYLKQRLLECRRILKDSGSLFLHCDRTANHYLKIVLDDIFGIDNFQSEIIWTYRRWSNDKKGLLNSHQTLYFYSKTEKFKFNRLYSGYSPSTNIDQIFQKRKRDSNGKTKYELDKFGKNVLMGSKKGVPLSDVWDIPYLNPKAKERSGYPTQKPILLLEKIVLLTTDENDIVLDPFCGSGTTLVAAKLLKRNYVGIDKSKSAVGLAKQRLETPIKSESLLLKKGRESYAEKSQEFLNILEKIGAIPVQRNKGIDGFISGDYSNKPIPVKIQSDTESLGEATSKLINACRRLGFQKKILIKTQKDEKLLFEMAPKQIDKDLFIVDDINSLKKIKVS